MRISDWSSDVCSSDLCASADTSTAVTPGTRDRLFLTTGPQVAQVMFSTARVTVWIAAKAGPDANSTAAAASRVSFFIMVSLFKLRGIGGRDRGRGRIGREACRERVCQYG